LKGQVSNDLHAMSNLDLYQTLLLKQPYREKIHKTFFILFRFFLFCQSALPTEKEPSVPKII